MMQHYGSVLLPRGGSALVDMTYYENAVHAMWLASQPACDHLPSARAWNISNGEPRTLRSIVQKLIDELGIKCRIRSVPYPMLDIIARSKLQESGFTYIYPTIEKLMNITDHHTVPELDIKRYMGRWYEIARYENHFERGMTDVTATYTLLPDGKIRVENEGYKGGVHKKATGRAKQPDPKNNPGKLKVAFFLWFYADYYILELDADYQYAVIGSSTDKYLWILSRERNLPEAVREDLLGKITERGYDISKLIS